jgi:hypothetical protein
VTLTIRFPGESGITLHISIDEKRRVRVKMGIEEASQALSLGDTFTLHAIEDEVGWLTFKTGTPIPVPGSVLAPGKAKWVRTSFRDSRDQHERAVVLAKSLGLTYCQWLRMLEAHELEKMGYVKARQASRYVG